MIVARVSNQILLPGNSLGPQHEESLEAALTIPNPDKDRAVAEMVYGAEDLPDEIRLFEYRDEHYRIPRGFAERLPVVLDEPMDWIDERVKVPVRTYSWGNPLLRDYQEEAVEKLRRSEQGVYEAPAGSGKTVAGLELIRRLGQRSVIIVNNTHIAAQWRERARQHLGIEIGLVGDQKWQEADITVALQPTLWMRRESLAGWWGTWGLVMLDECHHATAETFYDIIQRFPAWYRFGLSATPGKQKGRERLVEASIGPTVAKTERDKLVEAGTIVNPRVELLATNFKHDFWPTHRLVKDEETGEMVCPMLKRGCNCRGMIHRNNYSDVIKALIDDSPRNDLIAARVALAYSQGRAVLVLSRRLGHLDNMARRVIKLIEDDEDVFRLSGKEKTSEKVAIYERAERGSLVIFSTVGDEAMDIPRLDTLVLAFPGRNEGLVEQQVGRVARTHDEKLEPEVIDVNDPMGVFERQLKDRMRVYRRLGLTMTIA